MLPIWFSTVSRAVLVDLSVCATPLFFGFVTGEDDPMIPVGARFVPYRDAKPELRGGPLSMNEMAARPRERSQVHPPSTIREMTKFVCGELARLPKGCPALNAYIDIHGHGAGKDFVFSFDRYGTVLLSACELFAGLKKCFADLPPVNLLLNSCHAEEIKNCDVRGLNGNLFAACTSECIVQANGAGLTMRNYRVSHQAKASDYVKTFEQLRGELGQKWKYEVDGKPKYCGLPLPIHIGKPDVPLDFSREPAEVAAPATRRHDPAYEKMQKDLYKDLDRH